MHLQILTALGASAAVAGAGTAGSGAVWWMDFAEKFGVTAALLLYFVFRDIQNSKKADRRDREMSTKYNELEKRLSNLTTDYLTQYHLALTESTRVQKAVLRELNRNFNTGEEG